MNKLFFFCRSRLFEGDDRINAIIRVPAYIDAYVYILLMIGST